MRREDVVDLEPVDKVWRNALYGAIFIHFDCALKNPILA